MPAGYQDFFIEQGTTFNTQITLDDNIGVPYNLTNFTVKSQARTSYYTSNVTINFTSVVVDANNGLISISANASTTANVSSRQKLVYDVVITDSVSNNVTRVLEGQIFISPRATR
jgi:hypothetical protein